MKTLVTYACCEDNDRVQFFIKHAIFEADDVDFLFVINDETLKLDLPSYVKTINRKNIGFDFGAWSFATLTDNLYKGYDYFIFVNQSVVGPYLAETSLRWTDIFISKLTDDVRLVGSTINTMVNRKQGKKLQLSHVQSFAFCMNLETFEFLVNKGIFSIDNQLSNKTDVIVCREIGMSRYIIDNGWNIGCLLKHYDGVDFRFKTKSPDEYDIIWLGDTMYPSYETVLFTREEVMFIKGNRDMMY